MYGSNHPTRSSQDDTSFRNDTSPCQLRPVGGVSHAVRPVGGAVAGQSLVPVLESGLGGQSPAAMMHLHQLAGAPQGLLAQQGQHLPGSDAAGTLTLDQSLLSPNVLHTPPLPVMAKSPQPRSPLLVPPVHHTTLPRARQLFGGPTHVPIVQVGQPIQQQQVALPVVRHQALAWARVDEVLHLQQPTVQHMSPVQQRPIWQPPAAVAGSPLTTLPPHIHLQRELELQSQSLQLQLLHVQLQQQQLRHMQALDVTATGQYTASMITPAAAAAATASRNAGLASSIGGTGAGSAADAPAPARRKTRRGPNRGRSKNKKGVAVSSAGEQSGAQTSSTGGTASTASDTEELQQQASPTSGGSAQSLSLAGPASQQQLVAAGQRTPGKGFAKGKGAAGERQPQQPKEQSKTPDSKQAQDRRGSAPVALSPPAASQSASSSSQAVEPKQPAQRTTGLSHRQRYRRKQWELHRAMEQQRLQQQEQVDTACQGVEQQADMLFKRLEGVSLSATSGEQHVSRVLQQSSADTAGLTAAQLAPPAQSASQHGATGMRSTEGDSSSAALQHSLQQQVNTVAHTVSAAIATGSLDQHIDDWLSKFLEL